MFSKKVSTLMISWILILLFNEVAYSAPQRDPKTFKVTIFIDKKKVQISHRDEINLSGVIENLTAKGYKLNGVVLRVLVGDLKHTNKKASKNWMIFTPRDKLGHLRSFVDYGLESNAQIYVEPNDVGYPLLECSCKPLDKEKNNINTQP